MGSAKRSHAKSQQKARRSTRSTKGRLLTADPNETAAQLTSQLSMLGLYAAPTLGDGNCLFRALSDQYYGSPSRHVQIRKDICDWIEDHPERYEGFVDEDEFGTGAGKGKGHGKLDLYLSRMRENATYGGHMELSAFAHLTRRNIKVIQPGLVYVIQWDPSSKPGDVDDDMDLDDDRIKRRRHKREKTQREISESEEDGATIYVAYHDWEHFSSIRNLRGPHMGLPCIQETPPPPPSAEPAPKKIPKVKLKLSEPNKENNPTPSASSSKPPSKSSKPPSKPISISADPSQIPLPLSSAPSPAPSRSLSPARPAAISPLVASSLAPRIQRSPKRSFDESSASSEGSCAMESGESAGKRRRTRPSTLHEDLMDLGNSAEDLEALSELSDDEDSESASSSDEVVVKREEEEETLKTPFLSSASSGTSTSSSSLTSLSSRSAVHIDMDLITGGDSPLSSIPSPTPSPPPEPLPPPVVKVKEVKERPLTRRERKRLGLPKPRPLSTDKPSAGKIVIPGGRYLRNRPQSQSVGEDDADEEDQDLDAGEWRNNGSGRVDVRGFRELKI